MGIYDICLVFLLKGRPGCLNLLVYAVVNQQGAVLLGRKWLYSSLISFIESPSCTSGCSEWAAVLFSPLVKCNTNRVVEHSECYQSSDKVQRFHTDMATHEKHNDSYTGVKWLVDCRCVLKELQSPDTEIKWRKSPCAKSQLQTNCCIAKSIGATHTEELQWHPSVDLWPFPCRWMSCNYLL